ncbi:putative immunogenic protein [Neofusicoccum parvum UCRNP2]|uniref:Putative immunogenic protein n=1 Tax=Botryosphaeria parva (strain UCR-NP2) TaxID=1287680 RepID=R1E8D8_BOTPV|nr:putative immunogenic protein [Neofusicoccum parvum UCRNP2]
MSDAKPVDTPAAEPVAASETPVVAEAAPAEEVKTDAPAATDAAADAAPAATEETTALPTEEKAGEGEVKITAEPIYSGALGYKAPGLIKSLTFSKKYFWFGEEAAVPKESLGGYLRGEKGEHAHSTVAWASKTGKGLLFFAKHADQKTAPQGVLKLAEASEVAKEGNVIFSFKVHGHKHSFEASNNTERDGWVVAVEKSVEEAKAAAEGITSSDEYKETIEKLGKPTVAAAATKAEEGTPKKSTDVKPAEGEDRRGSSSSSSADDAEGKKKKKKSKSRSVSRKRASVFGGLLGKKEHEKKEVKKEEAKEEEPKKEGEAEEPKAEAVAETPAAEASTEAAAPAEEVKPAEGEEAKPEEAKVEAPETKPATSKANKRTSIFGGFFEKVRSPTTEKKEPEVAPVVPPKDGEVPATEEAAKPAETEAAPAIAEGEAPKTADGEAPATPAATTATTPAKEKGGFFSKFGKKQEAKSPAAAAEAPKEEAKPVETEAAPVTEGEAAAGTTATATATPEPGKEKRRTSFFGNFGAKANEGEADGEKKRGLGGLFRNPSKAVKGNKEKKENAAPAKVDEEAENKPEETPATEEAAKEEEQKKEEEPKPAIGDVVPDAVAVGQSSTPAVQATA